MDFQRLSREQRRSLERATKRYEEALEESQAISWLEARGIEREASRTFRLGFVDEAEVGHEAGEGRLAIPYLTPSGVVSVRFRAIDESQPKYWQPAGSETHLFNVKDLHVASHYIGITEGELDALVLSDVCGVPAVGIPGVNNWKPHFGRIFDDYDVVYIVMDGDKAGREAADKLKAQLRNGVVVDIGRGLDINDAYLEHGAEYVRGRLGFDD